MDTMDQVYAMRSGAATLPLGSGSIFSSGAVIAALSDKAAEAADLAGQAAEESDIAATVVSEDSASPSDSECMPVHLVLCPCLLQWTESRAMASIVISAAQVLVNCQPGFCLQLSIPSLIMCSHARAVRASLITVLTVCVTPQ